MPRKKKGDVKMRQRTYERVVDFEAGECANCGCSMQRVRFRLEAGTEKGINRVTEERVECPICGNYEEQWDIPQQNVWDLSRS